MSGTFKEIWFMLREATVKVEGVYRVFGALGGGLYLGWRGPISEYCYARKEVLRVS